VRTLYGEEYSTNHLFKLLFYVYYKCNKEKTSFFQMNVDTQWILLDRTSDICISFSRLIVVIHNI